MVTAVTSLGRSGLHDWFIQRLSAVIMAAYAIYFVWFVVSNPALDYQHWVTLFQDPIFKAFSLLTLLMMSFHIWIGMWIVSTDYIKPVAIRMVFQAALIVYCLLILFWGFQILWGV